MGQSPQCSALVQRLEWSRANLQRAISLCSMAPKDRLSELDDRRRGSPGDEAHARAVSDQQEERRSQQANG
mgnify:CR=1 FL=1